MRRHANLICSVLFFVPALWAQGDAPVLIGGPNATLLAPSTNATGTKVAFVSNVGVDGTISSINNLYLASAPFGTQSVKAFTKFTSQPGGGVSDATISRDGASLLYLLRAGPNNAEEVHTVDTTTGIDRLVASDSQGCIQPLALCIGCFYSCLRSPHFSSNRAQALYTAARSQPFYVANADGSGVRHLPIYSGTIAPAPQRVISDAGQIVFVSNAPSGPTFAAQANDVYLVNLDGSNLKQVTQFGFNSVNYTQNAVISADGNTIVFLTNYDPNATGHAGPNSQVWTVRADGTGLRLLAGGSGFGDSLSLSADGSTVAYVQNGALYLLRLTAGAAPVKILQQKYSQPRDVALSDDGSHVVFGVQPSNQGGNGAIDIVNADGSNLQPVFAPRLISLDGISSAAGIAPVAPGGLISVYGFNFGADTLVTAPAAPLPTTLGGVSLLVNGTPAPLLAVTPWQINAQLPIGTVPGSAEVKVRFADGSVTQAKGAQVSNQALAVFSYPMDMKGGVYSQAAVFHAGTGIPADIAHPAVAGEVLEIYSTGLGLSSPVIADGVASPANPPAQAVALPTVAIGEKIAKVLFAGLTPGFVGLSQINIVLPSGLQPNIYTVVVNPSDPTYFRVGGIAVK